MPTISTVNHVPIQPQTSVAKTPASPQLNPARVCATQDSIVRCASNPYRQKPISEAQGKARLLEAAAVIFIPGGAEGFVAKEVGGSVAKAGAAKWAATAGAKYVTSLRDAETVGTELAKGTILGAFEVVKAGAAVAAGYLLGRHAAASAPSGAPPVAPSPRPSPSASQP